MSVEKEGFASRWSRRKKAATHEAAVKDLPEATVIDLPETIEAAKIIESENQLVDAEALAKLEREKSLEKLNTLTDEDMPDLETLNENSDFSGFMSTAVSEQLRKMALKKLFHGKSYNIRDGLDEYDGDYTSFEKLDPNVITCDMKHLLEVEAEKLAAKEKEKEALLKADMEAEKEAVTEVAENEVYDDENHNEVIDEKEGVDEKNNEARQGETDDMDKKLAEIESDNATGIEAVETIEVVDTIEAVEINSAKNEEINDVIGEKA